MSVAESSSKSNSPRTAKPLLSRCSQTELKMSYGQEREQVGRRVRPGQTEENATEEQVRTMSRCGRRRSIHHPMYRYCTWQQEPRREPVPHNAMLHPEHCLCVFALCDTTAETSTSLSLLQRLLRNPSSYARRPNQVP